MTFQLSALWIVSSAGFFIAALLSLRNHFIAGRRSNLWLWFAVAMGLIGASKATELLTSRNPLWGEVVTAFLLVSAVILAMALVDFDKEVNICINCGSSRSDMPKKEGRAIAARKLRGF